MDPVYDEIYMASIELQFHANKLRKYGNKKLKILLLAYYGKRIELAMGLKEVVRFEVEMLG